MTEAEPRLERPPPPPPADERAATAKDADKEEGKKHSHLTEIPVLVLVAFLIAVLIKTFLVQAFFIPSESMLPTLQPGDRVIVEKLSYRFGDPERQDVVVFARDVFDEPPDVPWHEDARNFMRELLGLPTGNEQDYIKRIVALAGDTVRYAGKPRRLYVNGKPVNEPYIFGRTDDASGTIAEADCRRLKMQKAAEGCLVPEGKVFVMGDHRSNSEDSRLIGPIDEDKIVGHAFVVLWPPKNFGGL